MSNKRKMESEEELKIDENEIKIKFRNYKPYDVSITNKSNNDDAKNSNSMTVETNDENKSQPKMLNTQELVKTIIENREDPIEKELKEITKEDEINIVPKKPNWDLKSQIASKLDKLSRRTHRAIIEILREKFQQAEDVVDDDSID
jgi:coiled-coil domain-containing protein 12